MPGVKPGAGGRPVASGHALAPLVEGLHGLLVAGCGHRLSPAGAGPLQARPQRVEASVAKGPLGDAPPGLAQEENDR